MKIFAERFAKVTSGESTKMISSRIGLPACYIIALMCGENNPTCNDLCIIAKTYGVTTDYLLGRTEEKEPAQAEAGQAQKMIPIATTNNIAQSEEVVKIKSRIVETVDFLKLIPLLIEFAQQHFKNIRVIDQIGNDIAVLFNTKYLGIVPNDKPGRISLWSDIVKHHEQLQEVRAIEDFSGEDVTVEQGNTKKAVVVNDVITVINAMSKLYMTVTVA